MLGIDQGVILSAMTNNSNTSYLNIKKKQNKKQTKTLNWYKNCFGPIFHNNTVTFCFCTSHFLANCTSFNNN